MGYNTCWIQKIAVPAKGNYAKAYVGAKLGRMKSNAVPGRPPWEKKALPGEINIAVASSPTWSRKNFYTLTNTDDIPLEPDFDNAVENSGESQWFWKEVPLDQIKFGGDNYIALWSPTEDFTAVSSAPILAAAWGNKEANSWLVNDVKGAPPKPEKAFETVLTVFEPAIALKLIPQAPDNLSPPKVRVNYFVDGKARGKFPAPKVVQCSVEGSSIERAWAEISMEGGKEGSWKKYGRPDWAAPYAFSLKFEEISLGAKGTLVRVAAADAFENVGYSPSINLFERKP